jgi:hypothetical protein
MGHKGGARQEGREYTHQQQIAKQSHIIKWRQ